MKNILTTKGTKVYTKDTKGTSLWALCALW